MHKHTFGAPYSSGDGDEYSPGPAVKSFISESRNGHGMCDSDKVCNFCIRKGTGRVTAML